MTRNAFTPALEDLPETLPIFPLSGVLLLPFRQLPLNIFEPRYLNMTLDALGSGRLIGMIQPTPGPQSVDPPTIYPVGCAGRITAFNETDDGRLLINLTGVCRFRFEQELELVRGYRRVRPLWQEFVTDLDEPEPFEFDTASMEPTLSAYFDVKGIKVDWKALRELPAAEMVDFLSMNLPFAPEEKQALLESVTTEDRSSIMCALIDMATRAPEDASGLQH